MVQLDGFVPTDDVIEVVRGTHNHNDMKPAISIIKVIDEMRNEVCTNISKPILQIYNEHISQYVKTKVFFVFIFVILLETNKWYGLGCTSLRYPQTNIVLKQSDDTSKTSANIK